MINHFLFQSLFAWFIKLIHNDLFKNILKSSCMHEMSVINEVHKLRAHNLVTQLKIEYKHVILDTNQESIIPFFTIISSTYVALLFPT